MDAIVESMTFMLERAHDWEDVGFLPLGVWKTFGFESAHIEKKSLPEDVMEHHELGKMYPRAVTRHPRRLFEGQLDTTSGHHRSEQAASSSGTHSNNNITSCTHRRRRANL